MRMLVGYEGTTPAGHYVVPNSISLRALTVPVIAVVAPGRTERVAFASDLQREGKAMTMEFAFAPEFVFMFDPKKYEARVELYDLDAEKKSDGKLIVRKATLGSISLQRR